MGEPGADEAMRSWLRSLGCTCDPSVGDPRADPDAPGELVVEVDHDDDCPLLRASRAPNN